MTRRILFLFHVPAILMIGMILLYSCGGGDDAEDDRFAEFTCPEFELGTNPHEPGSPECDAVCLEWYGQWYIEVYRQYVKCIGSIPIGSSDATCTESREACLELAEKPKRQCADQCQGCLIDGVECEAACPEDEGCYYNCLSQLYQCNDWNLDCYNACSDQYYVCSQDAGYGQELIECVEEFVDCTIPCRESSGDDDISPV